MKNPLIFQFNFFSKNNLSEKYGYENYFLGTFFIDLTKRLSNYIEMPFYIDKITQSEDYIESILPYFMKLHKLNQKIFSYYLMLLSII